MHFGGPHPRVAFIPFSPHPFMAAATRLLMRPRAIFLNSARLDYDGALNFTRLSSHVDLTLNSVDSISDANEIANLVNSSNAEIVITKEMIVPSSAVEKFTPGVVKLMCEAGTG
jgi:hypothetical protein